MFTSARVCGNCHNLVLRDFTGHSQSVLEIINRQGRIINRQGRNNCLTKINVGWISCRMIVKTASACCCRYICRHNNDQIHPSCCIVPEPGRYRRQNRAGIGRMLPASARYRSDASCIEPPPARLWHIVAACLQGIAHEFPRSCARSSIDSISNFIPCRRWPCFTVRPCPHLVPSRRQCFCCTVRASSPRRGWIWGPYSSSPPWDIEPWPSTCQVGRKLVIVIGHIDGLAQEIRNSSALAMELRLSCTNPVISIG